ncbi:hypothetical protein [Lentzea sp. NPDC003310]|uniref:hypothetical protein n=1 Tax=Lentzea sp. NPDC003310 TaxID=3154447 RepID=UPI0033B6D298
MTAPGEDAATVPDEDRPVVPEDDQSVLPDADRTTGPTEGDLTPPDESRLDESQELIDEAKKIAHELREEVPDTTPEPPREEGSPAN